jgi:hypothetical protein
MKATLVDSIRPGEWLYEIKFDGYRALALRGGSETRILSRNRTRDDRLRQPVFLGMAGFYLAGKREGR